MDYLTDTTFLIDLWRERGKGGSALRFVGTHGRSVVGLPWVVKGEFLRGAWLAGHREDTVQPFLNAFLVVWPGESTLLHYARLYGTLRQTNAMVGPHDLWIAAAALEKEIPLLTRNIHEFSRVPGLRVVNYAQHSPAP